MSSNICSTARAAESSSFAPKGAAPAAEGAPAGTSGRSPMMPDLLHGQADNTRGYVAGNFDFTDFERQHEVNGAAHGLFVRGKPAQDLFSWALDMRQRSVSFHGLRDQSGGFRCTDPAIASNGRGGDHAPRHRFAVQKAGISGRRFHGVSDGMAEIQDAPEIGFLFIRRDDSRFHANGIENNA